MKVYAIQRESDGLFLTKRQRSTGVSERGWSPNAPDLWSRHQAARAAGDSVRGKYRIVAFELKEVSE